MDGFSDVEFFLANMGVDEGAANDFRGCPPEVQQIVMSKGSLEGSHNPSGALISRIKKAREQVGVKTILCRHFSRGDVCPVGENCQFAHGEHELGRAPLPPQQSTPHLGQVFAGALPSTGMGIAMDVETFLAGSGVDPSAANDLRGCPPEVQQMVMQRGGLQGSTNPSASLIIRIKKARESTGVKTMICRNFQATGSCQMGPTCQFAHGEHELGRAPLPQGPPTVQGRIGSGQLGGGLNNAGLAQVLAQLGVQQQGMQANANANAAAVGIAMDVEQFIAENSVDTVAANDLRGCPPEVQQMVLAKGSLAGTRNPNGALIIRIKKARESTGVKTMMCRNFGGGGTCPAGDQCQFAHGEHELGRAPLPAQKPDFLNPMVQAMRAANAAVAPKDDVEVAMEVESFIQQNSVDQAAGDDLRGCPPDVQQVVLQKGSLLGTRNPNAALIMRIKQAREQRGSGGFGGAQLGAKRTHLEAFGNTKMTPGMGVPAMAYDAATAAAAGFQVDPSVEAFIEASRVDEAAANDLRGCPPEVQQMVIQRGGLESSTNPSASLIIRIKKARESTGVKTMLCRNFSAVGSCQMGDQCQFAHGEHELGVAPLPRLAGQQPQQQQPQQMPMMPSFGAELFSNDNVDDNTLLAQISYLNKLLRQQQ